MCAEEHKVHSKKEGVKLQLLLFRVEIVRRKKKTKKHTHHTTHLSQPIFLSPYQRCHNSSHKSHILVSVGCDLHSQCWC